MTTELNKYECNNPSCSLGAVGHPGHFTGGITPASLNVLTGQPVESFGEETEGEEWGEGVCPNCGQKGTLTDEPHIVTDNTDPYQHLHDQVAARIADPDDPITKRTAQSTVEAMITAEEASHNEE